MSRQHDLYVKDILDAVDRIESYQEEHDLKLGEDNILTDAVIRNLEIIGEAVKNLPEEVKSEYPDTQWREIAGFRDVLIHQYFHVNQDIVIDVVENKLPQLKQTVLKIKQQD